MRKSLERITFFVLGAVVCSVGFLIGTSENPIVANPEHAACCTLLAESLSEHVTFKSITLADDEMTYTLTPRSVKITDANGHIEVGHGNYFPRPLKTDWPDYVLSGPIYEQMGAGVVDNTGINVRYEAGDVKITRQK